MEKSLTIRNLLLYYYRYKGTPYFIAGVSGVTLVVSLLLILFVIIPQIQHVLSVQREIDAVEKDIATMEKNQEYIVSVNSTQENQQTETVLSALPITKDYAGIYNAIVTSARESGVGLSNFQYQVGTLEAKEQGNSILEMKVSLSVTGGPDSIQKFITRLEEALPLSETRVISGDDSLANIDVIFYYGGEQVIQIDPKVPLKPLSPEKSTLISTLSSYKATSDSVSISTETSSGSAFTEQPF